MLLLLQEALQGQGQELALYCLGNLAGTCKAPQSVPIWLVH